MTDAQARTIIVDTIQAHRKMLDELIEKNIDSILAAAQAVTDTLLNGKIIYLCGNGGSAADAQHIAGEMIGRFIHERKALPAIALSTDTSVLTCLANDYSYDQVFARQIEALVKKGDLLWTFSTSGCSPNILAAAKLAKTKNATVLAFTGRANSPLEQIADICFCADNKLTARSQEIHQLAYHIICDLVEQNIAAQSSIQRT